MTDDGLKLLAVFAHPDDESLGAGATLARYADEGVATYLVTATRGERGWWRAPEEYPGPEALGAIREAELRTAAKALGLREVCLLDYMDGELDAADPEAAIATITHHIRRVRPHVVMTFAPDGAYGHPDHIAISQLTTAAVVCAGDPSYAPDGQHPAHRVSKLYYRATTQRENDIYESVFGKLRFTVDGETRQAVAWDEWAITTRIDTEAYWQRACQAIACHRSQLPGYEALLAMPEERHRQLWRQQGYYRAYSAVNGGRQVERDLFEGLR